MRAGRPINARMAMITHLNDNDRISIQIAEGIIIFREKPREDNLVQAVASQDPPSSVAIGECCVEKPLRKSLFGGIPPFINYVPAGGFSGGTQKGPQYWDENKVHIFTESFNPISVR